MDKGGIDKSSWYDGGISDEQMHNLMKHVGRMEQEKHGGEAVKSLPFVAFHFADGLSKSLISKAVRDVSGEARVPKGQRGNGEWTSHATEALNSGKAKP